MDRKRDRTGRKFPERQLFNDVPLVLTSITEKERSFIRQWCAARHLGEHYIVVATTYWLRCKSHAYPSLLMFPEAKKVYMILCIHLSLKHMGYEEIHKCNFLADLKEVYACIKPVTHQQMEWELFRYLNFDMGV